MLTRLAEFIICRVLRARWIVSTGGIDKDKYLYGQYSTYQPEEMGLRICGVNLWYYKWNDPLVTVGQDRPWRFARKDEFGETVKATRMLPEKEAAELAS